MRGKEGRRNGGRKIRKEKWREGKKEGEKGRWETKEERKARAGIPSLRHKDLVHTLLLEQLNDFRAQHGRGDSDGSGHLQTANGMVPPPVVCQRGPSDQTQTVKWWVLNLVMFYKLQLFSISTSKYSCNKPTLVCSTYVEDQVNFVTWQWLIMLATPFTERVWSRCNH